MIKLRHLLSATLLCATLVVSCALAQSNLTQILDTITNPDGTPFSGTVMITWNGYSGSGRLSTSAQIYNGALSVLLVPTTTAAAGTYYSVVYNSSNGLVTWTEVWQVPPSSTPIPLSQVRQSSTKGSGGGSGSGGSGGGSQYATLPIAINQVTNLSSSLSNINSTLNTLQATTNSFSSSITGLNNTVTSLSSTASNQGSTLSNLGTTVASHTASLAGLATSVSGLNGTVSGLNTTVASQGNTLSSLSSTIGSLTSTVTAHGTALSNLTGTVSGLTTTLTGHTNSITTLTSNLTSLTTTVSGNSTSLTSLTGTVGGLNSTISSLTNTVNGLSATVNTLSASSSNAVFVDAETPTGTINGSNTSFTLSHTPAPVVSLTLYRNGLIQTNGVDFTIGGSTLTFLAGSVPKVGDIVLAYYRVPGTGAAIMFTDAEMPGGSANGTNLTFTLASAPNPTASLKIYKNGVLLSQGGDYSVSGSSITFAGTATAPQTGDSLLATYRH
jgi:uncharacterized protein YoxC